MRLQYKIMTEVLRYGYVTFIASLEFVFEMDDFHNQLADKPYNANVS